LFINEIIVEITFDTLVTISKIGIFCFNIDIKQNGKLGSKKAARSSLESSHPDASLNTGPECTSESCGSHVTSTARVAILFSGGIDSTVIAALADRFVF